MFFGNSKKKTEKSNVINCSFKDSGSYSSILNGLEQDVSYIAKHSQGYGEIKAVIIIQKIDNMYCMISGSFLADCSFNGINFSNGYRFSGSDFVSFETTKATGFTTVEDARRELLLQFNWNDLQVYNADFTILTQGDYTDNPYISFSFTVKK